MKRHYGICVFAALFCALVCMPATVTFGQDKVITLRYSNMFPPTDAVSIIADEWCKEVEKRTGGKVKVKHYPANALSSPLQTYDSVVQGVVDIGHVMSGYNRGRFPLLSGLMDVGFEFPNAIVTTRIANAVFDRFKPKEVDHVKMMYLHCTPPTVLHTVKKPVNRLEDVKGMKIRTADNNAKIMSSLGAATVSLPQPEVYDGLSKGIIDGIVSPYSALQTWSTADIIKYSTEMRATALVGVFFVVMNKDKWNSIPPGQQKIIEQINQEWAEKEGALWDSYEKKAKDYAVSRGIKTTKLSDEEQTKWNAKAQPFADDYIKRMKDLNLPGDQLVTFVLDQIAKAR